MIADSLAGSTLYPPFVDLVTHECDVFQSDIQLVFVELDVCLQTPLGEQDERSAFEKTVAP